MPEMVAERIRDMIASGALKPGDRIPPQTALAGQMEVSRASVREGLKALEAGGYIQKLPNGRYRVTALTRGKLPNPLLVVLKSDPSLVWDLLEAARVMVLEAVRLAATRASDEDVRRLGEVVLQLEEGSRNRRYFVREFVRVYMNFYETVAGATGNVVYLHLGNTFLEVLAEALPYPDKLFLVQADISTDLYRQHLAIWEAVRDRDPEAATAGFRRHLEFVEEKLRMILGTDKATGEGAEDGASL